MAYGFLDIATTPSVWAAQVANDSAALWRDFAGTREFNRFTEDEAAFIAARDSFYIASVSERGWPYIQHRGGPRGFLRVLDDKTLGFADFRGNRQYISLGNIDANNRVRLFLMDYAERRRMKVYAHGEVRPLDGAPALEERLAPTGFKGSAERFMLFHLETFDWNCSQHITPRFTQAEFLQSLEVQGLVIDHCDASVQK